jgi:hypothetical protein
VRDKATDKQILLTAYLAGALLNAWLLYRSGYGADQIALLDLGLSLPDGLLATAKAMSGGARIPGSLLQLLIGLPLLLWENINSPKILIWILNLASGIVLWSALKRVFARDIAVTVFVLYWLSPWRIYHASLIWEPAFLFLPAAIHFLACSRLASNERSSLGYSALFGTLLTLTPQLHGSFIVLWFLTVVLFVRKHVRVNCGMFALGLFTGMLTLIPFFISVFNGSAPSLSPTEGYIGKGLVTIAPMLKGLLYWVRLGSLDIGVPLKEVVLNGSGVVIIILQIVGVLGIVFAVFASYWMIRNQQERGFAFAYVTAAMIAIVVAAALSPITLQGWHVIIVLHAAVIPVGLFLHRGPERVAKYSRTVLLAYSVLAIAILFIIGIGKPTFTNQPLPSEINDHPKVKELLL